MYPTNNVSSSWSSHLICRTEGGEVMFLSYVSSPRFLFVPQECLESDRYVRLSRGAQVTPKADKASY